MNNIKKCCSFCNKNLDIINFYLIKKKGREYFDSYCKGCRSILAQIYYQNNREQIRFISNLYVHRNKKKHYLCCRRWQKKNPYIDARSSHKKIAKRKNLKFELNTKFYKEKYKDPKYCSISNIKIKKNKDHIKNNSAILWRKNKKKGYTKKNVMLISGKEFYKKLKKTNKNKC